MSVEEAYQKRQYYRQRFANFVMIDLKEKYARQAGLFYTNDEHKVGRNLRDGANIEMRREAENYGIEARTLIIKLAGLALKHDVQLNAENYVDPSKYAKSPAE